MTNVDRFKNDFSKLVKQGNNLQNAIQAECFPEEFKNAVKKKLGEKAGEFIKELPSFCSDYQKWYSESLVLIKQLLPDRLVDFIELYEKPKNRKKITYENYKISDYLQNLNVTFGPLKEKVVGPYAAIPVFQQQLAILVSIESRFESSLFDIHQLVQADLFDSELDAARELLKNKFVRSAGALAGVVLEHHLDVVCKNHNLTYGKKTMHISDFNELLKRENVIDIPQWRYIQLLSDYRNLCDHDKQKEPSQEQVNELISGVEKITKTVF
ncbi:MAG: hypothetical protein ABFC34_03185 [Methanobacterium sp.]